jgi:hypothetical protein
MISALASLVLSGLFAFGLLFAFFRLVPQVVADCSSAPSFALQWFLVAVLVLPAIGVAYFGPSWLYEVPFGRVATNDQRLWLMLGGITLLGICFLIALRSSAGRRYTQWRSGSPNKSLERTREG